MNQFCYEPAHDLGLTGRARQICCGREAELGESVLRMAWESFTRTVFRIWNQCRVEGRENLPPGPPFVMVANHSSHLDALMLAAALPMEWRDQVYPLAAGDYFFSSPGKAWFGATMLNALPVWRHAHNQTHALEALRNRLLEGRRGYIVFPEGTRTRDGQMGTFKPGIGMLVAGTGVPVIPCYVGGTFEAMPPGSSWVYPRRITLQIGRAMSFATVPNHRAGWQQIATDLEASVRMLGRTEGEWATCPVTKPLRPSLRVG